MLWFRRTLASLLLVTVAAAAGAATFTVDDAAPDVPDGAPGDGACATAGGTCTLLAAIEEANSLAGLDAIVIPAGVEAQVPDGSTSITEDASLSGGGSITGAGPASLLEVAPGTNLAAENIGVHCSLSVEGSLASQGIRFSGRFARLIVTTGATAALSGGTVAGLDVTGGIVTISDATGSWPFMDNWPHPPLMLLESGSLTLERVTLPSYRHPWDEPVRGIRWIEAVGGLLVARDSRFEMLDGLAMRSLGADVVIERSQFLAPADGTIFFDSQRGTMLDISGGSASVSHCEFSVATDTAVRIASGAVAIEHCCFLDNFGEAVSSAGNLRMADCFIQGTRPYSQFVSGWPGLRGHGLFVTGGIARVDRCRFVDNAAEYTARLPSCFPEATIIGAAIRVDGGDLTVADSEISSSRSGDRDFKAAGGAVAVLAGALRMERCLLTDNLCMGDGGALSLHGGSAELVNTTIIQNEARGRFCFADIRAPGAGGAINAAAGTLTLRGCTVAGNVTSDGAAVAIDAQATVTAFDTLFADEGPDCSGILQSGGYLLVEDPSTCALIGDLSGVQVGVDPALLPLAENGGPTATSLPGPASPARDATNPAGLGDGQGGWLAVDQRDRPRVVDGNGDGLARGDLGAAEACDDPIDTDADGRGDTCDSCPLLGDDGSDADHDGLGDACDSGDSDGDTIADEDDVCPRVPDAAQADMDADAVGDACDGCPQLWDPDQADADRDGVGDACDNAPSDCNSTQRDSDGDGSGDAIDPCPLDALDDSDGDGRCADADNCPLAPNPDQVDSDGDGIGDACDEPLEPRNVRAMRVPGGVQLTWSVAAVQLGDVHVGDLDTIHLGLDMPTTYCGVTSPVIVSGPSVNQYYLVGGHSGDLRSPIGADSFGNPIAPTVPCP